MLIYNKQTPFTNYYDYVKGETSSSIAKLFKEKKYEILSVSDDLNGKDGFFLDLNFLSEFDFLEGLTIWMLHDYTSSYDFFSKLINLKKLMLLGPGNQLINFSLINKLENLSILSWNEHMVGLEECINLRTIDIDGFNKSDFTIFNNIPHLEEITLDSPKLKSLDGIEKLLRLEYLSIDSPKLKSLDGIERLLRLKYLSITNCSPLKSVKNINGLTNLQYLELNKCPNIRDLNFLHHLPNLKVLKLINCKKIPTINFVKNFKNLNSLILTGNTFIEDDDLKYLDSDMIECVLYPPFIYRK